MSLVQPRQWVNEYWAARRAALKPVQYAAAQAHGLMIAETLITNDPAEAGAWLDETPSAISKTLSSPVTFDEDGERGYSFTRVLDDTDRQELESVAVAPTQFQTLIEPAFELRITSIGSQHFAVRIDADLTVSEGIRDWRSERLATTYSWFELPDAVAARLTAVLSALRLQYAASDFIVTTGGDYVYLESNPHGAWLWLEDALGDDRISRGFAETLLTWSSQDA